MADSSVQGNDCFYPLFQDEIKFYQRIYIILLLIILYSNLILEALWIM